MSELDLNGKIVIDLDVNALNELSTRLTGLSQQTKEFSKDVQSFEGKISKANKGTQASTKQATDGIKNFGEQTKTSVGTAQKSLTSFTAQTDKEVNVLLGQLSRARYALYDTIEAYNLFRTAGMTVFETLTLIGVNFDKSFAEVVRTSGATLTSQISELRNELLEVYESMPVKDFDAVNAVAKLGGQLGVATRDLDTFTDSVIRFSSTTDIQATTAGEKLGRIAQLTKTPIANIEQLTSAIYYTGINAVATEEQILKLSEQISVSGNMAGFANYQIVALASALASLGIQPERARGTIERLFATITTAVSSGSEELERMAEISGMTADQFTQQWQNAPQEAFVGFLDGVKSLADSGGDITSILSGINISAVRDVQAVKALSDNMDVYKTAIDDTTTAYANGTAVMDGYAITTETLSAKFQMMTNKLQGFLIKLGDQKVFKAVIDLINKALDEIDTFFGNNKLLSIVATTAGAVGLLTAGFSTLRIAVKTIQATILAFVTANTYAETSVKSADTSISGLIKTMFTFKNATSEENAMLLKNAGIRGINSDSLKTNTVARTTQSTETQRSIGLLNAETSALSANTKAKASNSTVNIGGKVRQANTTESGFVYGTAISSQNKVTKAVEDTTKANMVLNTVNNKTNADMVAGAGKSVVAVGKVGSAFRGVIGIGTSMLKTSLWGAGITVALGAVGKAFEAYNRATESATEKSERLFNVSNGLAEALKADTLAGSEKAMYSFSVETEQTVKSVDNAKQAWGLAVGIQKDLADSVTKTTQELKDQTIYVGENSRLWLANELYNGDGEFGKSLKKFWTDNQAIFEQANVTISDLIDEMLNPEGDPGKFFNTIGESAFSANTEIQKYFKSYQDVGDKFYIPENYTQEIANNLNAFYGQSKSIKELSSLSKEYKQTLIDQGKTFQANTDFAKSMGFALDGSTDSIIASTEATESSTSSLEDNEESVKGLISVYESLSGVSLDVEESLYRLGASLGENGTTLDVYTQQGRANLEAIAKTYDAMVAQAGNDTGMLADNIVRLMATLQNSGVDTSNELAYLGQSLSELTKTSWNIDLNLDAFNGNISNAIKNVRTLLQAKLISDNIMSSLQNNANASFSALAMGKGGAFSKGVLKFNNKIQQSLLANAKSQNTVTQQQIAQLDKLSVTYDGVSNASNNAGKSFRDGFSDGAKKASQSAKKASDAIKNTTEDLRTFADYASDLGSVISRAFELRYGTQNAVDDIAKQYIDMADKAKKASESIEDAKDKIEELDKEINKLRGDNNKLNRQLNVALEYKDYVRADDIRAKIEENNSKIDSARSDRSDTMADLVDAYKQVDKSLSGYSDTAIDNRSVVLNLIKSYQAQITALASSGASTEQLQQKTSELRNEFVRQLTQMGYNRAEVEYYAQAFNDLAYAINTVPRNITVSANTDHAEMALNEFIARNNNRSVNINANVSTPSSISGGAYNTSGINVGYGGISTPSMYAGTFDASQVPVLKTILNAIGKFLPGYFSTGGEVGYYSSGGQVGFIDFKPRGRDTVPTMLEPGEFVARKKAVDYYGVDFFNSLNNLTYGVKNGSAQTNSTTSGSSSNVFVLDPSQFNELVKSNKVSLVVNGKVLAKSVNDTNANENNRGF